MELSVLNAVKYFLVCLAQKLNLDYYLYEVEGSVSIAETEETPPKKLSLADRLPKALKECNESSHILTHCVTLPFRECDRKGT